MKISEFVGNISGGLARTNRYDIIISPPPSVKVPQLIGQKQLAMLCDQVQLPGLIINTTPIRIYGEVRETPYEFNYEPINMQFLVDTKMGVKIFFDAWIQSIQNGKSRTFEYYKKYITDIDVIVQDTLDQNRYMVKLYECYPKSVGAVQMDYASKDIMKLNVTMMFKYWEGSKQTLDVAPKDNPLNDARLPFGLPGLPSSLLKIPSLSSFF